MSTSSQTVAPVSSSPVELSIVSPVYHGEFLVEELVRQIVEAVTPVVSSFEIILVDDGSPDRSWERILALSRSNPHVKGIKLARNFGQHFALTAGLDHASGEFSVVIDCDLQQDPREIPRLLAEARKGSDIVYTEMRTRAESWGKAFAAKLYYIVYNFVTENKRSNPRKSNLSLLSRKAREAFCSVRDTQRHYLLIVDWLGFPSSTIEIDHRDRHAGTSSYTLLKLINHAIDGIVSQSTRVLRLSVLFGLLVSLCSLLGSAVLVVAYFVKGFKEGWASLAVLTLLCTGSVLLSVGIASLYIGKIFDQVKGRPLYLVVERANLPEVNVADRFPAGKG